MNLLMSMTFQITGVMIFVVVAISAALLYFQHVRLERPAVGVFNIRDILIIFVFVIVLPLLYVRFPSTILTVVLTLTFAAALYIGFRPLLRPRYLWPLITLLLLSDIVTVELSLGPHQLWQLINSGIVLCAAVGVSNLYIQGGMRMKHVAWVTFLLGFYDGFTAFVTPLTAQLAERLTRQPLGPTLGITMGHYAASIGLGDVLVYCLFMVSAYKGFGKRGAITAFVVIISSGVLVPSLSVLLLASFIGTILPVQFFFGPVALLTYFWLSRRTPERTMAQWFVVQASLSYKTAHRATQRVQTITEQHRLV